MKYNLVANGDDANITVFHDNEMYCTNNQHPRWDQIVAGVVAGDTKVLDLFEVGKAVSKRFERLTERVTYKNGVLYFDGEQIKDALTDQIVRFLEEGNDDFLPLTLFLEKVATNPNEHSREQLYRWLASHNFSITPEGDIVGYKGVKIDGDGNFRSTRSGFAIVDGEEVNDYVTNNIGSVIEMPRGDVQFDPSVSCHTGLHVANWDYACSFVGYNPETTLGSAAVLEVHVNPRDVVSVPTDASDAKVRCCRYKVIRQVTQPYSTALVAREADEPEVFCNWAEDCTDTDCVCD